MRHWAVCAAEGTTTRLQAREGSHEGTKAITVCVASAPAPEELFTETDAFDDVPVHDAKRKMQTKRTHIQT